MDRTEPSRTTTPSATSARAPMKQLSSTITGPACNGSSTPPIPAPPEMWQLRPIWAHEPTGHRAEAGIAKAVVVPAGEFRRHLVPPRGMAGTARNGFHVVETER